MVTRSSSWLVACGFVLFATTVATAQQHHGPGDTRLQPFGDYGFENDLQWFAPAETWEYGGEPIGAKTGWFFAYDRAYINVSRGGLIPLATDNIQTFQGDFTWGNRYELGYMTEEDYGWLLNGWYIKGPQVDTVTENGNVIVGNLGQYASVDLNRTWRLEPFYHGGFIEPFIGLRFSQFIDYTRGKVENNMIGAQLGARYFKQKGNWVISGQAQAFPMLNYQMFQTFGDGATVGSGVQPSYQEFVIGGEARIEIAYLISKTISIRAGWDLQYFGRGIARNAAWVSQPGYVNDEHLVMTGATFGFTINR
jgi:hypothetical protein